MRDFAANVESFQVLYADDLEIDGQVDAWVKAGEWSDEGRILGVRIALLLSGSDPVVEPLSRTFELLDSERTTAADGKLHRKLEFTISIRGHGQ